jgi:sirohydrochlorin cobaltochelatase
MRPTAALVLPESSNGARYVEVLQDYCDELTMYLKEAIGLTIVPDETWAAFVKDAGLFDIMDLHSHVHRFGGGGSAALERARQKDAGAAPMAAAPFVFRDDGTPDWGTMWQGFCELALYGGPSHRGDDEALTAPTAGADEVVEDTMIEEIRRGIAETTGLSAEPSPGGWLSIKCDNRKMAAWLCATIILENVEARSEGDVLYVPGDKGFELKNQVKSVITVVAKTHHYWQAHIAGLQTAA